MSFAEKKNQAIDLKLYLSFNYTTLKKINPPMCSLFLPFVPNFSENFTD